MCERSQRGEFMVCFVGRCDPDIARQSGGKLALNRSDAFRPLKFASRRGSTPLTVARQTARASNSISSGSRGGMRESAPRRGSAAYGRRDEIVAGGPRYNF
jgi:hypothetical protein